MVNTETILFKLISLGLEEQEYCNIPLFVDWKCLWKMASLQGVSAICLDGLQKLDKDSGMQLKAWRIFMASKGKTLMC